jgi:hypothetical protein
LFTNKVLSNFYASRPICITILKVTEDGLSSLFSCMVQPWWP